MRGVAVASLSSQMRRARWPPRQVRLIMMAWTSPLQPAAVS
jgi:hypothetical protein